MTGDCGEERALQKRMSYWQKKKKKPQWVTFCVRGKKDCTGTRRARLDTPESLGLTHFFEYDHEKDSPEIL